MSDRYSYNILKTLTQHSPSMIDGKTLLTYGMIGITCAVLGVATLYDEMEEETDIENGIEEENNENNSLMEEITNAETPFRNANVDTTIGGKRKNKKRVTKRKYNK